MPAQDSGGIGFEDTGGELRLYQLDYASSLEPIKLVASLKTPGRFASLDWSLSVRGGASASHHPLGLVAGGLEDGSVVIWDVEKLLVSPDSAHVCTVTSSDLQGNRITALRFHPSEPWVLAMGTSNGSVVVANVLALSASSTATPISETVPAGVTILDLATAANHSKHNGEVTALAWNSQVAHILASSSLDGSVGVWDLKTKKPWCKLQVEQAGVSTVAWSPKEGLWLITASADDRNPVLKVYDLGSSTSLPLTTMTGHTSGILSCSWCPHDETLLLSSSRDNRVLLWDLCTLQPFAELPPSDDVATASTHQHSSDPSQLFASSKTLLAQKHLRVSAIWSPCKRGLCMTTSLDKKVQVHSILALATRAGRPPKWLQPSGSCVSTSFGGVVVRTHKVLTATDSGYQPQLHNPPGMRQLVTIYTMPEQPHWVESALQLEEELSSSPVVEFCHRRQRLDPTTQLWGFMSVITQANARESLLGYLGFDAEAIAQAAQRYHPLEASGKAGVGEGLDSGFEVLSLGDSPNGSRTGVGASSSMSAEVQDLVKRSLVVGNFEAAVECCYKAGNLADALLIASCGRAELWSQTQQRYLADQQAERPYLSLLTGIVQLQWDSLVAESNTSKWKETLALLSSYAESEEFPRLCIALGDRLDSVGAKENASLCYICALSLSHASKYWISQMERANARKGGSMDWKALQDLVMKVTVFQNASATLKELPHEVAECLSHYAQTLADQGLLSLAARYCKGTSMESRILRDRLYRSRSSHRCLAEMGSPPEFPYSVESFSAQSQQLPSTSTSSRSSRASRAQHQRQAYESQQQSPVHEQHSHQVVGQPGTAAISVAEPSYATSAPPTSSDVLPPGWLALQDPASGMTYYANETTGETTWDRPVTAPAVRIVENMPNFPTSASTPIKDSASVKSTTSSVTSASKLVSKYGDGFVTSASHPELADQYGNVGTSNPYTGVSRPGTAAAVLGGSLSTEQAPPSGPVDLSTLELEEHHAQMKDTLLGLYDYLVSVSFPSENRQLEEAKKGIDILIKKLARKTIEDDTESKVYSMVVALANHDIRTAAAIQTSLVSTDWKAHKDWLKGIKVLLQLATKKM